MIVVVFVLAIDRFHHSSLKCYNMFYSYNVGWTENRWANASQKTPLDRRLHSSVAHSLPRKTSQAKHKFVRRFATFVSSLSMDWFAKVLLPLQPKVSSASPRPDRGPLPVHVQSEKRIVEIVWKEVLHLLHQTLLRNFTFEKRNEILELRFLLGEFIRTAATVCRATTEIFTSNCSKCSPKSVAMWVWFIATQLLNESWLNCVRRENSRKCAYR